MHVDDDVLQRAVGQLATKNLDTLTLSEALGEIVSATPPLFGADGAGILLADEESVLRHCASTDQSAHLLESVQESAGRGPCVSSLIEDQVVATSDIAADPRWPDLGELLAANGIRAILGSPIHVAGTPLGSLNVYKKVAYDWDDSDVRALTTLDGLVERLLTAALLQERNDAVIAQLEEALRSRLATERAVGIVMATEGIGSEAAFERIRGTARSSRRTVRDIAAEVTRHRRLQ